MADLAIRVEGLGKRYRVGHQAERDPHYTALRDVFTRQAKALVRTTRDLFRGEPIVQGDAVEEFWALRDVAFEITQGERVGIIGRNGAGKSTLLKILSRITEPTTGRVELHGRVASLLEVGTGFHPELTGRENIFLNGAILGMRRREIQRNFDEIVNFAEIERFLDTPVKHYSTGMYMRLAFAVAAHLESEILIVDEVLAVGDASFQRKCLMKMRTLSDEGRTLLVVSHNTGVILDLCDRAVLLYRGHVDFDGAAAGGIARYRHAIADGLDVTFPEAAYRAAIVQVRVDRSALAQRTLRVAFRFQSPTPLREVIGGIAITDAQGIPVWGSNGRFHPIRRTLHDVCEGEVIVESEQLPLIPGRYALSVWLSDRGTDLDAKIDCLAIDLGTEQYDLSRPPIAVIGSLDWPATWR